MLRVMWKICKEEAYVKLGNWLVFDASGAETLKFCRLVLSLLLALPGGPKHVPSSSQRHNDQSILKKRNSLQKLASDAAKNADRAHKASAMGFLE